MTQSTIETSGTFVIGDNNYPVNFFKITHDKENYFCAEIDFNITGEDEPDLVAGESYVAKFKTATGEWYFPWVWFKEDKAEHKIAETHGAIFCPKALSKEDEERYDAINLIVASEVYQAMTEEVWKNLLIVFAEWLHVRGIPQASEFRAMSEDVEVPEDPLMEYAEDDEDEDDEDDEDEGSLASSGEEDEEE